MKKYFRTERITEDEFITATGFEVGDCGQTTVILDGIIYTAVELDRDNILVPTSSIEQIEVVK